MLMADHMGKPALLQNAERSKRTRGRVSKRHFEKKQEKKPIYLIASVQRKGKEKAKVWD